MVEGRRHHLGLSGPEGEAVPLHNLGPGVAGETGGTGWTPFYLLPSSPCFGCFCPTGWSLWLSNNHVLLTTYKSTRPSLIHSGISLVSIGFLNLEHSECHWWAQKLLKGILLYSYSLQLVEPPNVFSVALRLVQQWLGALSFKGIWRTLHLWLGYLHFLSFLIPKQPDLSLTRFVETYN